MGSSARAEDPPAETPPTVSASSDSEIGTKGAWADSMKAEFLNSCNAGRPESIAAPVMNSICSCSLNKLEKLYAPQDLGTPEAIKKAEETGASCAMGTKGAWSSFIKKQFMSGCVGSKPDTISAEAMNNICSCSMTLIEGKYSPDQLNTPEANKYSEEVGVTCGKKELEK